MKDINGTLEVEFQVREQTLQVKRPHLKLWLELDSIQKRILSDINPIESIIEYLFKATEKEEEFFKEAPWFEVAEAYIKISYLCIPKIKFPLFIDAKQQKPPSWDYPERYWYAWCHIFSKAYGWNVDTVSELEIETAFGLLQEIMVEDQLQREWEWSITEIAYPYNSTTKKSEFKPLPRPSWMKPPVEAPKKQKILREALPVGNVIDIAEMTRKNKNPT